MRYIEPHGHMVSRTTDDYQAMVMAGCAAVCEPAFWAGYDRKNAHGFYDYFLQLTEYEPRRAKKYHLPHYTWLCINPKESEDTKLADDVIALIPDLLSKPNVLGIGEIGLNKNSRNELLILEKHLQLAADHDQLVLVHTPHLEDKLKGTRLILYRTDTRSQRQVKGLARPPDRQRQVQRRWQPLHPCTGDRTGLHRRRHAFGRFRQPVRTGHQDPR